MVSKIDKVSNSMAEYGFYQFYQSLSELQTKQLASKLYGPSGVDNEDNNHLQPITMEQLKKPITIILCLNGIATILVVAEVLLLKWMKLRDCKQQTIF